MKAKLILLAAIVALITLVLGAEESSAYNYAYGNTGYLSPSFYYPSQHYPANNYMNVYDGRSKYGPRYIGGIYPAYYQPQRPYGYQGGNFYSGYNDYYKVYKPASSQYFWGRGTSDWYYDGGRMVRSRFVMY